MQLINGDCLKDLLSLKKNSVDTIITDPPYEMGILEKGWDKTGISFNPETWKSVMCVAKPGALMLAFGGARTFHRISVAVEDAGWKLLDTICWLYGSGMPKKCIDIGKEFDRRAGVERKVVGQYVRPDGSMRKNTDKKQGAVFQCGSNDKPITEPATEDAKIWNGWYNALRPAWEPIIVAMKPLDGHFVDNAKKWGVAGFNINGGRIENPDNPSQGRWPANVIIDSKISDELDKQADIIRTRANIAASRFFYCAKVSQEERGEGNDHVSVKPLALMRYLVKLTKTPFGGVVLDPFMGSGTTGLACVLENREFIGIEMDKKYYEIACKRIDDSKKNSMF